MKQVPDAPRCDGLWEDIHYGEYHPTAPATRTDHGT